MNLSNFDEITSEYEDYITSVINRAFTFTDWLEQTFGPVESDSEYNTVEYLNLYEQYLRTILEQCFSFESWCEQTHSVNLLERCMFTYKSDVNAVVWEKLIAQGLLA